MTLKLSKFFFVTSVFLIISFTTTSSAYAHFGMIIPSDQMVMKDEPREINLKLMFKHPFENQDLGLEKPEEFGLVFKGRRTNLLSNLKERSSGKLKWWEMTYGINRPGLYVFYMKPRPYWEPSEDCFIVHYTKTYVTAFGNDDGWDEPIGLKAEIVPLSKPYGLYAGNVFQGIVLLNGKPVPFTEVEVEFYNREGRLKAPSDLMITQTIKTDPNGVFTYAAPQKGWWGFAALFSDKDKIERDGQLKEVEIGAVIWVRFH
ncbi:MAG: DUF4198 domain-containing protein [Candidatus Adiutricales bacterium]